MLPTSRKTILDIEIYISDQAGTLPCARFKVSARGARDFFGKNLIQTARNPRRFAANCIEVQEVMKYV